MNKEELSQLADLIAAKIVSASKEVLTSEEAAKYMGISKSYLYKLTMRKEVPHYKPMGKVCYFNRLELDGWLQSNRVATDAELSQRAQNFVSKKGGLK
jgi:excisionase family DNA binding protein